MPNRKEPRRFGKPKKPAPNEQSRKCITCGKSLPPGIRYCVSCGTHDETELDARIAELGAQVEQSRKRNFMLLLLSRMTFGFWRF